MLRISPFWVRFLRFSTVGGSGVIIDMVALYLLSDVHHLGLGLSASKFLASELAIINNFLWNSLWTFRAVDRGTSGRTWQTWLRRLIVFNAICSIGAVGAVLILHVLHVGLGWNLYLSNFLTIIVVALWNFTLNARLNWRVQDNLKRHLE